MDEEDPIEKDACEAFHYFINGMAAAIVTIVALALAALLVLPIHAIYMGQKCDEACITGAAIDLIIVILTSAYLIILGCIRIYRKITCQKIMFVHDSSLACKFLTYILFAFAGITLILGLVFLASFPIDSILSGKKCDQNCAFGIASCVLFLAPIFMYFAIFLVIRCSK